MELTLPGNLTPDIEIQHASLEEEEEIFEGEEKATFLRFVRKMVQWAPEDRPSAEVLIRDPWLALDC
jgi:hypothetical protein